MSTFQVDNIFDRMPISVQSIYKQHTSKQMSEISLFISLP